MSADETTWVLLHGLGDDGMGFVPLERRLEAHGYSVVRPNLHATAAAGSGDLEAVADEIHSRCVGARNYVVVGHSLGALVGTCMVRVHGRARGIVAIEGSFSTRDANAVGGFADPSGRRRLLEYLSTSAPSDSPESYRAAVKAVDDSTFAGLACAVVEHGRALGRSFFNLDLPKLFMVGANAGALALAEHDISGARQPLDVHVVRNAGHWAHCDAAEEAADVVEQWAATRLLPV